MLRSHLNRWRGATLIAVLAAVYVSAWPATVAAAEGDWPTYHRQPGRGGVDPTAPNFTSVHQAWTSAEFDGDIYAEPLYVAGRVLVATENNSIYALDAASGDVVWQTKLGPAVPWETLNCGNIRPIVGITSTPAIDLETGLLYTVALTDAALHYQLYALNVADGSLAFERALDPPGLNPRTQGQRGALALANGQVYVTFGNRSYPSCDPWNGWVVGASAGDPSASLLSYTVPTSRAGIWAPGGPSVDADGNVFVAVGEGPKVPQDFPHSESVIKLSASLEELDFWAPDDWPNLDRYDIDIGSISPTLLPDFGLIFQGGKNSFGYLLQANHLGQVGGDLYQDQVLPGQCGGMFGATAYLSPLLYVPCGSSILALKITESRSDNPGHPGFSLVWKGPEQSVVGKETSVGSPIVAGGAVWATDPHAHLVAMDAATGEVRYQANLPGVPAHFATPTSGGGRIYAAGGHQIAAFELLDL
jgi:outer membrane protein assembly factor BamB